MTRFTDVPTNHWAFKEIDWVSDRGILNGTGGGKFGPKDAITREQLAAVLYRSVNPADSNVNPFGDIDGNPFKKEILALTAAGVFSVGDKFYPTRFVTRGELAVALSKAFKFTVKAGYESPLYDFKDLLDGHWARTAVKALYTHGVILDSSGGNSRFYPGDNVFREDLAFWVYGAFHFDKAFVPAPLN